MLGIMQPTLPRDGECIRAKNKSTIVVTPTKWFFETRGVIVYKDEVECQSASAEP